MVLDYVKKFDPDYNFYLLTYEELELFLAEYQMNFDQK